MDQIDGVIGNCVTEKIEDAYNSERANLLRSTIEDQTFRYCQREACPHLQNDDLEDITPEEYERRKKKSYYPSLITMAHDFICNHYCETCRRTVFKPPHDYAEKMREINGKIAPYLDTAKRITTSGHGDPFASKYMMEVLENLHPTNPDVRILLETNGVLFDEQHWERIKHLGEFYLEVIVTTNSLEEFTFNHVSRGGNYKKMLESLEFMSQLRRQGDISMLISSFVVQDRNFRELPSFIKRSLDSFAFDRVVLKPVHQWGTMDEDVFWFKNVRNPLHPYHQEFLEIMRDPVLSDPRVYNFGGNMLTEARPYPESKKYDNIFPYGQVRQNSNIVIYGAGQIGREIVTLLKSNCYCNVILWVDKSFDNECIMPPERLIDTPHTDYDYVILATLNKAFAEEMKSKLIKMGVPEEQIIPCERIGRVQSGELYSRVGERAVM
jgi:wyosine [tRNA(Phe)-imidazoG37] synthetase (radical SAM superfamily)